jgi:endonuclease III
LIKKYGIVEEGVGKGSVDWESVRVGSEEELFETIKCGGLANTKSKNIKKILEIVREENLMMSVKMERDGVKKKKKEIDDGVKVEDDIKLKAGLSNVIKRETTLLSSLPPPSPTPPYPQPQSLSLDHLHLLPTALAREHLESLPGIGPKTAACVLMFCMQRDVFPVDTHVWRLCKWLGWTKEGASRDATYLHCGELKVW